MTDEPLNYPGGMTDGPPAVLSAHQLAHAWLDAPTTEQGYPPWEWRASDGSNVHHYCMVDLDYHMAHLLRVTAPDNDTVDMLAVYVRHGRHPVKGWNLDVAWWQHPVPFFDQSREWLTKAHHWFVDWTFAHSQGD